MPKKERESITHITSLNGLTIASSPREQETALRIRQTCEHILPLIANRWGLTPPTDLYVYVMTENWLRDILISAPFFWRIMTILTLPLWYFRISRMWIFVGGWQQQFGRRRVVGIKPTRLLETSNRSIGEQIYIHEPDFEIKVQHLACHELTHAFTAHLRLPAWLNEGLAMVSVDQFVGKPTIKLETLKSLHLSPGQSGTSSYRKVDLRNSSAAIYTYVRGYWITRFLEETQPGLLKSLLAKRIRHTDLETKIALSLNLDRQEFWRRIDRMVIAHFTSSN